MSEKELRCIPQSIFPPVRVSGVNTRYSNSRNTIKIANLWRDDTDIDDLIEMTTIENGIIKQFPIDYRSIVALLIVYNNNKNKMEFSYRFNNNEVLLEYKKEIEENSDYLYSEIIKEIILNAQLLYLTLHTYQNTNNILISDKCIRLYRGFNLDRYNVFLNNIKVSKGRGIITKPINKLRINEIINTTTFLSTTIDKNTSLRFASLDSDNIGIIWQIIVMPEYFKKFNYTYLGNDTSIIIENNPNLYEAEILLNLNAKFEIILSTDTAILEIKEIFLFIKKFSSSLFFIFVFFTNVTS